MFEDGTTTLEKMKTTQSKTNKRRYHESSTDTSSTPETILRSFASRRSNNEELLPASALPSTLPEVVSHGPKKGESQEILLSAAFRHTQ
jgi:hypothetical protein